MAGPWVIVCHADVVSFRPFPSRERALRQVMRRHDGWLPVHLLPDAREPQGQPGVYVLSTRRPGVVSGPA
ncbi:hypothetical protein ACFW4Q_02705 [Streptomyces rochei]|uniref:hypothetical protein n=1 Tax=Streptomyces rochei TaxID=1928 RepID=UPI0036A2C2D7